MTYLVEQVKGTKTAAQALGISQRTVERYVSGKLKRPRQDLRGRLEPEVKKRWEPQIRAEGRKKAATTDDLVVSTRPLLIRSRRRHDRRFPDPRHCPGSAAAMGGPPVRGP
ncbi:telomere-protecting terminal protein Tpg [Streptomyces mexicanus]|jgi:hypothetical protein|uniref:telomere-protecting terminal protein Tpg n=1 Tax=Streptomyces mexicanus TaxID=178566 RepID=UPI003675CAEB